MNALTRPRAPLAVAVALLAASVLLTPSSVEGSLGPTGQMGTDVPHPPASAHPTWSPPPSPLATVSSSVQHVFIFNVTNSDWLRQSEVATDWLNSRFDDELDEGAVVWIRHPGSGAGGVDGLPRGVDVEGFPRGGASAVLDDLEDEGFRREASYVFDLRQFEWESSSPSDLTRLTPAGMQWYSRTAAPSTPTPRVTPTPVPTATPVRPGTPRATPAPTPSRPSNGIPVDGATLLSRITFEDGERDRPNAHAHQHSVGTTDSVSRSGSKAGYSLLSPDDRPVSSGGYRAELWGDDLAQSGDERWNGISYYIPHDYDQGSNSRTWNDRIIYQFTDTGSPMFSLHLNADGDEMWVRRKLPDKGPDGEPRFQTIGRWSVDTGRWYDIVFHARWSTGGSGFFEVYVNGDLQADYEGRTLAERRSTSSKWGIYGQPTKLYYDDVWMAEGSGTLRN